MKLRFKLNWNSEGKIMLNSKDNYMITKVFKFTFLLIGLFIVCAGQANAQSSSIAGEWDAAMNTPGGVRSYKVVFKVDGEKLTGTVKRAGGDVPLEGTIKGKDVKFSYAVQYNGNNLTISIEGKLEGDTINGTVSFGESGQQDNWSAKKTPENKPTN